LGEVTGEEKPRIGVFVCHCGTNIGGIVKVPEVVEYAKTLPDVVFADQNLYTCSEEGLAAIKLAVKEHNLNRVVVASCSPRTHEPLFRAACESVGVNKYLFDLVNIRDHCSWVHMREPGKATEKAKDLVRMAVARARYLEAQQETKVSITKSAVVIGGGVAGMTTAVSLADQGFDVTLVEKEAELGGLLNHLHLLYPGMKSASETLAPIKRMVEEHSRIKVMTSTTLKSVKGFVGNFDVALQSDGEESQLKVGTIIVATGAAVLQPKGLYGYGELRGVTTQLELEEMLRSGKLRKPKSVVMILCAGSRIPERPYCSRVCCMNAIKNALVIKEKYPDSNVYILYRDIQAYGRNYEEYYRQAREEGVTFVMFLKEKPPEVSPEGREIKVSVYDPLLGEQLDLKADLVVLSTPFVQRETGKELSQTLRVPLSPDGFFMEAHAKLRPVDFATEGIFLCGTARGPADVPESVGQAFGAAARAAIPMALGQVMAEAVTPMVDVDICVGCGLCERLCPYGAIKVEKTPKGKKASVAEAACKGCGVCGGSCPNQAITMRHFTNKQILAQVEAAFAR